MPDIILVDRSDPAIPIVTINRPEVRNPVSDPEMLDELVATFEQLDRDPAIRAVILTGAGSAFSSGGNLRHMGAGGLSSALPADTRRKYKFGIHRLAIAFEALEVPVIAAVNGPAIGAGCDLACMCDVRLASDRATFSVSFVKIGLVPGDGGAWLLPRIVGFSKATEMALTGDSIDAAEALRFGLVSKAVAEGELMDEARKIALRIAANPTHAVRMTKRLLRDACNNSLSGTLELSAPMQALAHATRDHEEAVAALLEKRRPTFSGS